MGLSFSPKSLLGMPWALLGSPFRGGGDAYTKSPEMSVKYLWFGVAVLGPSQVGLD